MRILIAEEALKGLNGHWFQYISDIVNGGQAEGHEIEVAVHSEACAEILTTLPCRPILRRSVFQKDTIDTGIKRIIKHNCSLYCDLAGFLDNQEKYDVIISTTTRVDHIFAYVLLYWKFRKNKIKRLVLIFIDSVANYSDNYSKRSFSRKYLLLKLGLKLSRLVPNSRFFNLVTESEGVARQYSALSGADFFVVPHVTVFPALDAYRGKAKPVDCNEAPCLILATYGFTRYDKGLDILQEALKLDPDFTKSPHIFFILQWTGDYQLPNGSWVRRDPYLQQSSQVSYIPPFVVSDEYYRWIARTNIMVLPYRRRYYYDRPSRVAIDAAIAGIPIIYPKGTWLETFVSRYAAGVAFEAENPASLAGAISEAISRYDELKTIACSRIDRVSEAFSAKNFFMKIELL